MKGVTFVIHLVSGMEGVTFVIHVVSGNAVFLKKSDHDMYM